MLGAPDLETPTCQSDGPICDKAYGMQGCPLQVPVTKSAQTRAGPASVREVGVPNDTAAGCPAVPRRSMETEEVSV